MPKRAGSNTLSRRNSSPPRPTEIYVLGCGTMPARLGALASEASGQREHPDRSRAGPSLRSAARRPKEPAMYQRILVPVDLADPDLAKPALETAVMICNSTGGSIRLMNVLPVTPVMLAEYVPADFEVQQRKSAE